MSSRTHARVGHPEDNDLTLYQRGGVSVTENWLIVEGQRYRIRHLRHLRTVRGRQNPLRVGAAIAAGIVVAVTAITANYLTVLGWIGAAVVLTVPLTILVIAAVHSPRPSEMWGEYRGYTAQLLWLENREHYNQVCRAITRARERMAA